MAFIPKRKNPAWARTKRTGFQEENRKTDERYHTVQWRKLRKMVLNANPLCVMCEAEGITNKATDVDHINPVKLDDDSFWLIDNLQGLCGHHHKSKSAKERRMYEQEK